MNILITGSSGYLGRFILKKIDRTKYNKIICIIYSEKRYKENEFLFENCIVYKGNISDDKFISNIFNENKIDYIIHSAAMKYIDTCEKFQEECINTNIIGTLNLCKNAVKHKIKNMITISTDKAVSPISLYGITKLASEKITLSHGYMVYQCVNFWNSDGSFLQRWKTSINLNEKIILNNINHIRYFKDIKSITIEILNLIDVNNNKINYPKKCWKIKILDVFNILKNYYPNNNFVISNENNNYEKIEEYLDPSIEIDELSTTEIKDLINNIFKL